MRAVRLVYSFRFVCDFTSYASITNIKSKMSIDLCPSVDTLYPYYDIVSFGDLVAER